MKNTLVADAKTWLRPYCLDVRKKIKPKDRNAAHRKIAKSLLTLPPFQKAKTVAVYLSFGSEVSTDAIIRTSWGLRKSVVIPDLRKGFHQPRFLSYNREDKIKKMSYGPSEKIGQGKVCPFAKIDLVLVPGLAFDRTGYRLGFGRGVYDRFLRKTPKAHHLGLFYSQQEIHFVPRNRDDSRLDAVLTNREIHIIHNK